MNTFPGSFARRPAPILRFVRLFAVAALFVLALASPAAADDPGSAVCLESSDGVMVCPKMEVEGRLRQPPQVVVVRESLEFPVDDLRTSFLPEIESSVLGDPF